MAYIRRIASALIFGVMGTAVLVMLSIAFSWVLALTWRLPFVLWVSGRGDHLLFEPHPAGLVVLSAGVAVLGVAVSVRRS